MKIRLLLLALASLLCACKQVSTEVAHASPTPIATVSWSVNGNTAHWVDIKNGISAMLTINGQKLEALISDSKNPQYYSVDQRFNWNKTPTDVTRSTSIWTYQTREQYLKCAKTNNGSSSICITTSNEGTDLLSRVDLKGLPPKFTALLPFV